MNDPELNPFSDRNNELKHYGIRRKSGRYPWGSGGDAYQRSTTFYKMIDDIKQKNAGISDTEISKAMGLSVADFRSTKTLAKEEIVHQQTLEIKKLAAKGMSPKAIAEQTGIAQPTVRLRLKNQDKIEKSTLTSTADAIRKEVDEHKIVDIGKGTEFQFGIDGIADTKLRAAVAVLHDEGYVSYTLQKKNVGTNNFTNTKVLVPPGTTFGDAKRMIDQIHTMGKWTENDGKNIFGLHYPKSFDSKRLAINFKEDGGHLADGMLYIRPGVKDVSIGKNNYAQVRVLVDGTHFIKGMAVHKTDLPDGVDIVFNSNKSREVGKLGALKPITNDPDNPFGSVIKRQIVELDAKGNEKVTSVMNLLREEKDWDDWRNSLPSQMLAKQPHSLIKSQLQETRSQVEQRIAEIKSITNPVVRRKKLEDFADQIDADAVDLRAAQMPRQRTQVIMPVSALNKNEIYAPQFETGDKVVLIRYPHGGRFEIPEVTVNNNNRTAKSLLGNAADAIAIHPKVAEKLSGADFDGDTVIVIPNRSGKIKGINSLGPRQARVYEEQLGGFDAKKQYGGFVQTGVDKKGDPVGNFKLMKNTGLEMGMITNLITDMSIQGATADHVVRAVKHSMVVIDAEKHKLDYRQSAKDHNIAQLKELYQGSAASGAKTLLSKATSDVRIPDRKLRSAKEGGPIDPKTGEKVYVPTGRTNSKYDSKTQTYLEERVPVTVPVKRLALEKDALNLARDPNDPVERLYGEHANAMKAYANKARLDADKIKAPLQNPEAKKVYGPEIASLNSQLRAALKQAPLSRHADTIAGAVVKTKLKEDPSLRLDRDKRKKVERQAKAAARARLGLEKPNITISDREWDAIQSGAISASKLKEILRFADEKRVTELSLPRTNTVVTPAVVGRAKAMLAAGATNADVAAALGISASTLREAAKRGDLG